MGWWQLKEKEIKIRVVQRSVDDFWEAGWERKQTVGVSLLSYEDCREKR